MFGTFFAALLIAAVLAYLLGRTRAFALAGDKISSLHSRPIYHGGYAAILTAAPALLILIVWNLVAPRIHDSIVGSRFADILGQMSSMERETFMRAARSLAGGAAFGEPTPERQAAADLYQSLWQTSDVALGVILVVVAVLGIARAWRTISLRKRSRQFVERFVMAVLIACSIVAILTTIGIVFSLIFESLQFFQKVSFFDFLFGTHWSPQSAFEGAGQEAGADNSDVFGAVPLFAGTLLITTIAMLVAAPIGLMSAIYLSDYAAPRFRAFAKPILEILAGIPTVVYGFFAALTVAPFIRRAGEAIGLSPSSESALAAGLVMGIMIIPFVSSLSDDVINAVPQSLRDGSAGMGATKSETIRKVVLPAALPGIVSAMLLAVSRAIGETMIVVMAAGLAANLTINPLQAVTTVTVQIVTLLVGDQEFDSAKTLAAFALGLVLFIVTLILNVIALRVVQSTESNMSDIARTDLTDFTIHRTEEARRRLARRYATERRFKSLGLAAVLSAIIALLLLLSTIVTQAIPAFTMNYATLPVTLSGEHIDNADLGKSDFDAVTNDAIDAALPFAEGRTERRAARGLLSDAAGIILREEVLDDPALVGAAHPIALPVSDTVDLYLKGLIVEPETVTAAGTATPSAGSGEITIQLDRAATGRIRADLAESLRAQAGRLSRDASRAAAASDAKTREVEALTSRVAEANAESRPTLEADLSKAQGELTALQSEATGLQERSAALLAEADASDSESKLGADSPSYLLHIHGGIVKVTGVSSTGVSGEALVPLQGIAAAQAGEWRLERLGVPESSRQISDREVAYVQVLQQAGFVASHFNTIFFTRGASREPEMAGILGAVVGSFLTLIVTLGISFPIGVAAAVYLEEFAPKNRWTTLIEVNINNLAAVPSIVFGLLGLAVFLNFMGLPRSAPIVGGMVLALMTLPIIIIASRAALKAVPPSIREAALGVGASKIQTVFHHVLPLAMPGIMTGTILGMAHALGETAPLLMIGMVAFIVDVPHGIFDPATLLPVQIFMWADFPEQAFQQKTSAAILVLLSFLVAMNAIAVVLRRRFERRW